MRPSLTILGLSLALLAAPADAAPEGEAEAEPPPSWRFRKKDRPVKVISLAGSVGAYPRSPYSEQIEKMCSAVEVKNISKTGLGAWALKKRFKAQVLGNHNLNFQQEGWEYWLLTAGGLNSIAMPESGNYHTRELFMLAHRRGIKVVAFSVTPWGDAKDKRFRMAGSALKYRRATQKSVDFVMGRLSPREALGSYANKRKQGPDAAWDPTERPDVAVDLYDSPLRDRSAEPRDLEQVKSELERDPAWRKAHAKLDDAARQVALDRDAREAAEIPRYYMREELRAFDHIHPNVDGHRLMAERACPSLPASWSCSCP